MRISCDSFIWIAYFLTVFLGAKCQKTLDEDTLLDNVTQQNEDAVTGTESHRRKVGGTKSTERASRSSPDTMASAHSVATDWDRLMEDFSPELLLTFRLPPRTDEYFHEDIAQGPPVLLRGGFLAASDEGISSIDFSILDPSGELVYERHDEVEGLFHFYTKESGTYTFVLGNHKWLEDKMVTFTVGKGNNTHLQSGHLEPLEDQIKTIERTLISIQTESTFLWIRQKSHMTAVETIHSRVLAFCIVEFLVLVAISGFQVYYIKELISGR